mmetsp:Transcript_25511/g.60692  ORF Transcript_25511/g.60692 Transcript_25511/m.60692 type:complete len:274 (-) Transcript_25511:570-1391(-)
MALPVLRLRHVPPRLHGEVVAKRNVLHLLAGVEHEVVALKDKVLLALVAPSLRGAHHGLDRGGERDGADPSTARVGPPGPKHDAAVAALQHRLLPEGAVVREEPHEELKRRAAEPLPHDDLAGFLPERRGPRVRLPNLALGRGRPRPLGDAAAAAAVIRPVHTAGGGSHPRGLRPAQRPLARALGIGHAAAALGSGIVLRGPLVANWAGVVARGTPLPEAGTVVLPPPLRHQRKGVVPRKKGSEKVLLAAVDNLDGVWDDFDILLLPDRINIL